MYNIIILIIASDDKEYYIEMQQLWKKYMNIHPNIKSYFIKGKQPGQNDDIYINEENNTIYANCEESIIPGILIKTIKCFEYLNNNFEFKYIYIEQIYHPF